MQFHERKKSKVIINITSLIDVLFLLLIFFMVSSTFIEQPGMKLELPEAKSSSTEKIQDLILDIHADGTIYLNSEPIALEKLGAAFEQLLPRLSEKALILKADKSVPHGTIVKIMDTAKLSGLEKLIIATRTEGDS
ncbi:MAG: biopolymer transporter ExbD [bacterium]|nr:biopolymer transporter ExbD [bacterium]